MTPNVYITNDLYTEILIYSKSNEITKVIIDTEDINKISEYSWWISTRNYVCAYDIINKRKRIRLHRLIMNVCDNRVVDHIDRNPLNNKKENLRVCTQRENKFNNSMQGNNTSGTIGVYWYKAYNKWKAQIKVDKKSVHLGYYEKYEDAVKARESAEIKYFGEYSPLYKTKF